MSVISTSRATERLSRILQRNGFGYWIGRSSGDAWGKYLLFQVGGKCCGSAGWSLRQAAAKVEHLLTYKDADNPPPFTFD